MPPSIATIPPERYTEWQALLQRSFSARWGREYLRRNFFRDYVTHDPHHRARDLVGLMVDGKLASTCQVFRRRMVIGTRGFQVEGIGNVGTDVDAQGQGYGAALLRGYLRGWRRGDATFVFAREGELYRKLGWQRLVSHRLTVDRRLIAGTPRRGMVHARRVTSRDLPALARIYTRFNRAEGLPHVVRSAAYWTRWVAWKLKVYRLTADIFLEGARPVGYAFWSQLERGTVIEEYGALPSARSRVYPAMLGAAAGTRIVTAVHVMRPARSLEQFLDAAGVEYQIARAPHETGHAIAWNPALRPASRRLALWHVDHF